MRALDLTLLTDLYELTMMQGYFKNPTDQVVVFDAFYRQNPCDGGYAIAAGLEQMIEYIENLHFSPEDIDYLRSLHIFEEDFLEYLSGFHFTGDIYAIPLDTHAEIMYYNTDILEKAGVELNADGQLDISSKDDFFAILDKCKAVMGDGESVISLINNGDDPYRVWWATYFQMGGTPLVSDDGTEVTMDKDIAVKAAEFVKSLYDFQMCIHLLLLIAILLHIKLLILFYILFNNA